MPTARTPSIKTSDIAMIGPLSSFIARSQAATGVRPCSMIVFHRFHHDDSVVDDQSDGENQSKERQRVDAKRERNEEDERFDQRYRDRA